MGRLRARAIHTLQRIQHSFQSRTFLTRAIALVLAAVLLTLIVVFASNQKETQVKSNEYYSPLSATDKSKARARATIGMFIQKVYDFNPQSKTFAADGYVWMKWKQKIPAWDNATQDDPALTLEFTNAAEKWNFVKTLSPEDPYTDDEGWSYQAIQFSGKFLASNINLRTFPFETIILPIEIESDDFWINDLLFELDAPHSSGASSKSSLQGYSLQDVSFKIRKHIYKTSMGLEKDARREFGDPEIAVFSNFVAELKYQRVFASSAWQLLLPLAIVSSIAFLTPLVDTRAFEAKIALPTSVILTLVFLQNGYKEMLPASLAYLTMMDKIYILAYISILGILGQTIWFANKFSRTSDEEKEKEAIRIRELESRYNLIIIGTMTISALILWVH